MAGKKKVKELPSHFTEYCSKPYDQNSYEVHLNDGRTYLFDDYEEMRSFWWTYHQRGVFSHVIIVDKVQIKEGAKGF
jgi:hypothetical protein